MCSERRTLIDSTTMSIDEEYSEELRIKSECFLYNLLCKKHGKDFVKWLNINGESYSSHDFEIIDANGNIINLIECKGTSNEKGSFEEFKDYVLSIIK